MLDRIMFVESLSREERLCAVFAAYGRAMLDAHGLELRLATLLSVQIYLTGGSQDEQSKAVTRIEQQPMGSLIRNFITYYRPSDALMEELDNMLYFRNELVHRISNMILLAATKENWETPLINELIEISEMFNNTQKLLEPFMAEYRSKVGMPEEAMLDLGRRLYPGVRRQRGDV